MCGQSVFICTELDPFPCGCLETTAKFGTSLRLARCDSYKLASSAPLASGTGGQREKKSLSLQAVSSNDHDGPFTWLSLCLLPQQQHPVITESAVADKTTKMGEEGGEKTALKVLMGRGRARRPAGEGSCPLRASAQCG